MPLPHAARILRPRTVRLVGWTALAFAGLTITAGIAHADDAPEGTVTGAETAGSVAGADAEGAPGTSTPLPTATDSPDPADEPADATTSPDATDSGDTAPDPSDAEPAPTPTPADDQPTDTEHEPAPAPITPGDDSGTDADGAPSPSPEDTDPGQAAPTDPAGTPDPSDPAGAETGDAAPVGDSLAPDASTPGGGPVDGEEGLVPEDGTIVEPPAAEELASDDDTSLAPESLTATTTIPRPSAAAATSPSAERRTTAATSKRTGFTDVPANLMYADEILWMQRQGYATGWPDGTFRPLEDINRDAFVAMIYRVHAPKGYTAPTRSRFVDVPTNSLYYREISWAAQQGITTGWSDGTFRPLDPIDRDAALAMLRRSFGGGTAAPSRSPFTDVTPKTEHYDAMAWGFANGITTGWSDGSFRPQEGIHRDAMAVMIHRLVVLGPDAQRGLTGGPTGTHWATSGGNSQVGAPTGYQYRYGDGLRQDFARGSVLYSPTSGSAVILRAEQKRLYDARGGQATFGMPAYPVVSVAGSTALQFRDGGIYSTDGFTFVVTGAMYDRYQSLGGVRGYLGAPIGDQRTGSSGITYQSFKGGQLTTPEFRDTPPPTTVSGGTKITYRTLTTGHRGDDVYAVQVKVGAAADGVFGAQTREAVMRYQRSQGLAATGIVDTRTWARIMSVPDQRFDGSNGRLAADQLTIVAPNWTLPDAAASAYTAMQKAFTADTGRIFTLNDAYRPIDRQIQLLVALGRPTAAFPGTSPHGDARRGAVDIQVTRGDVTHRWLLANAARFGFGQTTWQAANEPWHWERR